MKTLYARYLPIGDPLESPETKMMRTYCPDSNARSVQLSPAEDFQDSKVIYGAFCTFKPRKNSRQTTLNCYKYNLQWIGGGK